MSFARFSYTQAILKGSLRTPPMEIMSIGVLFVLRNFGFGFQKN